MKTKSGRDLRWSLVGAAVLAFVTWSGLAVFAGDQIEEAKKTDPYYKTLLGWEARPLEAARKQGQLVFQSEFTEAGLARDWQPDGVAVELKDGTAVVSLSAETLAAKKKYGALWAKTPFAQPLMIEMEFTLDPSSPHDANVYWGQKTPTIVDLGKEQECYIMGYFGWGGRCSGFEGAKCGSYGICGAIAPRLNTRYTGTWIIQGKRQCLYLDGVLLVTSDTPTPPPASGYMALSVYQSKVLFHSVKVYSLTKKK